MSPLIALPTILRTPTALRPLLLHQAQHAHYHSAEHASPPPYRHVESTILSAALAHVPAHGFTPHALTRGAQDAGYRDISTNLFPNGPFDLVTYHLVTQRLGLKDRIHFAGANMGLGRRVRSVVLERLRANADAGIVGRWHEALAWMSLVEHIPASVHELALLADEMWFVAGDVAVDGSWYTKRASLAAVYAATEVYQTTDQSTGGKDTEDFLDQRLEEARVVGSAVGNTLQWAGFQGGALVHLLRSKGVRI